LGAGRPATRTGWRAQQALLAKSLGNFLQSLHEVDTANLPAGPEHWGCARGVKVLGATVVRIGDEGSIGMDIGYPPSFKPEGFEWDQRQPIAGASVPSQQSGPPRYVLASPCLEPGWLWELLMASP
jgi:hypothetical protein